MSFVGDFTFYIKRVHLSTSSEYSNHKNFQLIVYSTATGKFERNNKSIIRQLKLSKNTRNNNKKYYVKFCSSRCMFYNLII